MLNRSFVYISLLGLSLVFLPAAHAADKGKIHSSNQKLSFNDLLSRSKRSCKSSKSCCKRGPKGPKGDTGATGPQGPQGCPGPAGVAGSQGLNGFAGLPGVEGAQGPVGPAGTAGAQGANGAVGPAGTAGAQGANGAVGPAGTAGAQGAVGPAGTAGAQGPVGPAGTPGAQGPVGPAGTSGAQGANGYSGTAGMPGMAGVAGEPGCCGGCGSGGGGGGTGPQGPAGPPGPPGPAGQTGCSGSGGSGCLIGNVVPFFDSTTPPGSNGMTETFGTTPTITAAGYMMEMGLPPGIAEHLYNNPNGLYGLGVSGATNNEISINYYIQLDLEDVLSTLPSSTGTCCPQTFEIAITSMPSGGGSNGFTIYATNQPGTAGLAPSDAYVVATGSDVDGKPTQVATIPLCSSSPRYLNITSETGAVVLSSFTIPQCQTIQSPLIRQIPSTVGCINNVPGDFIGQLAVYPIDMPPVDLYYWDGSYWEMITAYPVNCSPTVH